MFQELKNSYVFIRELREFSKKLSYLKKITRLAFFVYRPKSLLHCLLLYDYVAPNSSDKFVESGHFYGFFFVLNGELNNYL